MDVFGQCLSCMPGALEALRCYRLGVCARRIAAERGPPHAAGKLGTTQKMAIAMMVEHLTRVLDKARAALRPPREL